MVQRSMSHSEGHDSRESANGATPEDDGQRGSNPGEVSFAEPDVATAEGEGEQPAPASQEPVQDPLAVAKAEAAKYREQLLRTAADFDNFRKRSRRESEDALRKGKETALKDLLPVFDNLERAIQSSEKAPDVKAVVDGLKLVGRQFTQTLDKMGIRRIPTVGHPFDPGQHEAIQHVESEHPAGVIAAEVQAGYALGEHLIRAALVAVSKGSSAPADAGPGEPPNEDGSSSDGGEDPTPA
jgi:molecular chaperone GrpE